MKYLYTEKSINRIKYNKNINNESDKEQINNNIHKSSPPNNENIIQQKITFVYTFFNKYDKILKV